LIRSYSICSDPQDRSRYLIAVKRTSPSRGGSQAMHAMAEGEVIAVSMPRNHFPLDPRAGHHLLVAAGIGITPLLAMAIELRRSGRSFALHYFTHSVAHTAFHEELSGPGFHGKVQVHAGLPRHLLVARLGDLLRHHRPGAHVYLCGPEGFMETAVAQAGAWPRDSIHMERFHADHAALERPREAFQVRLSRSRRTLQVGADESIADALYSNGFRPPTSCKEGVCGSCVTRVVSGECDHRDGYLSPAERAAGDRIMLCVSRARGRELVLDL
jgi:vanillate O-demethylase ferredoxin subunit